MSINVVPDWMVNLDDEDVAFIKRFLLASGSLKEIAKQYDVTYPTVRLRLDRLIQKIQIEEALERIADGAYGTCAGCGKPIEPGRLEIIPYAIYCINCQKEQEIL